MDPAARLRAKGRSGLKVNDLSLSLVMQPRLPCKSKISKPETTPKYSYHTFLGHLHRSTEPFTQPISCIMHIFSTKEATIFTLLVENESSVARSTQSSLSQTLRECSTTSYSSGHLPFTMDWIHEQRRECYAVEPINKFPSDSKKEHRFSLS